MREFDLPPIVQGDTFTRSMGFTDDDGEPIDITGWEMWVTVKQTYNDSDEEALIQKHITEHEDPEAGKTNFVFTDEETSDLIGRKVYDVQVKLLDGSVLTVLYGVAKFTEGVTHA